MLMSVFSVGNDKFEKKIINFINLCIDFFS